MIEPTPLDVLMGKDKARAQQKGNQILNALVVQYAKVYTAATTDREQKMEITKEIVDTMRLAHNPRFLKLSKTGLWQEVSERRARDKVSRALRRMVLPKARTNGPSPQTVSPPAGSVSNGSITPEKAPSSSNFSDGSDAGLKGKDEQRCATQRMDAISSVSFRGLFPDAAAHDIGCHGLGEGNQRQHLPQQLCLDSEDLRGLRQAVSPLGSYAAAADHDGGRGLICSPVGGLVKTNKGGTFPSFP